MVFNHCSAPPIGVHSEVHDYYSCQQEYPHDQSFLFGIAILCHAIDLC
jgi:hypothetical protein